MPQAFGLCAEAGAADRGDDKAGARLPGHSDFERRVQQKDESADSAAAELPRGLRCLLPHQTLVHQSAKHAQSAPAPGEANRLPQTDSQRHHQARGAPF